MRQLSWLQQRWIRSVHRTFSRKHSSTFSRAVLPRQYSISTILQAKPQQVSCQYFHSSTVLCSQTIFALSSGHGKCGVAVIRVSGPKCRQAVLYMTRDDKLPPPRVAVLKRFSDAKTLQPIDRGLLLWFPGKFWFCIIYTHVVAILNDNLLILFWSLKHFYWIP